MARYRGDQRKEDPSKPLDIVGTRYRGPSRRRVDALARGSYPLDPSENRGDLPYKDQIPEGD